MKKVKLRLTKSEIISLYEGLKRMKSYHHSDLSLAKHRTMKFLSNEYEPIIEVRNEAMKIAQEYDAAMHEYLSTMCKTDIMGRPMLREISGQIIYDIDDSNDKKEEISSKVKELDEKFKESIAKRKEALKAYDAMIQDKAKTDVFVCQIKYKPEEMKPLGIDDDMEYAYILFDENSLFEQNETHQTDKTDEVQYEEVKN